MNVDNSWITLRGFTIDGEEALKDTAFPTELTDAEAFKDPWSPEGRRLEGRVRRQLRRASGAWTGTTLDRMTLVHAGGECVRLRDDARRNVI